MSFGRSNFIPNYPTISFDKTILYLAGFFYFKILLKSHQTCPITTNLWSPSMNFISIKTMKIVQDVISDFLEAPSRNDRWGLNLLSDSTLISLSSYSFFSFINQFIIISSSEKNYLRMIWGGYWDHLSQIPSIFQPIPWISLNERRILVHVV